MAAAQNKAGPLAGDSGDGQPPMPPTPEAMFRSHASAVLAVCLARSPTIHDAEDVMQDVFVTALTKLDQLRDHSKARGWLLQIARRRCIDHHRRTTPAALVSGDLPDRAAPDNPRIELLRAAIAQLPETYREAITLYYMDGRNCAGVADSLGISPAAARQRLVRARLMLHELLRETA